MGTFVSSLYRDDETQVGRNDGSVKNALNSGAYYCSKRSKDVAVFVCTETYRTVLFLFMHGYVKDSRVR